MTPIAAGAAKALTKAQRGISEFTREDRDKVRELFRVRRFLKSVHTLDLGSDYVWRPKRTEKGGNAIRWVHLPSGKTGEALLSHQYIMFSGFPRLGFHCLIDDRRGAVYHQGFRDAPDMAREKDNLFTGARTFGRYLVATEIVSAK